VLVLVGGETSFSVRRAEGLKSEERLKYTRFECGLEKGVGQTGCCGQERGGTEERKMEMIVQS